MASQKRHPEIPNFAGEMMEFMAGKPSNEEIYKYLEKTDLAAMNWLSEHKITDDFRLEAELFTEHLISDCEDIDNLFEEIYDRWPVFGPMLLHIGGEYQVDIDNATIKECIDEMVRVILDFKGSIVVIPFWDMGCYGFGRWVHSIPADRSKTRIKEERRFLRSVLNTITLHGGHVLIWRYSDEEKGLGEFVRGFTYSMGEFTPMTPSSFENAIRYAQANEPVLPIPGVMRGFPESYASRLLYGNVDHLFKGLGGQTTDDKDTLIKEE